MNEQIAKHIRIIFSRSWILLILAIAAAGAVYLSKDSLFEKMYEAKMKMIITLSDAGSTNMSVYDSLRSSQMAVADISQIISSDAVLAGAEKDSGVNRLIIGEALKIDSIPGTRILDISIEMNAPERALKLVESLDKNLRIKLKEIDGNIAYKILSRPNVNSIPVNQSYPVIFAVAAGLGGLLLGALINLILGDRNLLAKGLNCIHNLYEEENILLVPASKIPRQEGDIL